MPRTRSTRPPRPPRPPADPQQASLIEALAEHVAALTAEMQAMRLSQQRTFKAVLDANLALTHRLSVSRDQISALIKASHTELLEHITDLDDALQEQRGRIDSIERDFESIFESPPPSEDPADDPDNI
jgi:isopropylmalate/homocitrate/citramalate synthase